MSDITVTILHNVFQFALGSFPSLTQTDNNRYFIKIKLSQDRPDDLQSIDSCEYIWEAGVGFPHSPPSYGFIDQNRHELITLLLTCFSESMYVAPTGERWNMRNSLNDRWICFLTVIRVIEISYTWK